MTVRVAGLDDVEDLIEMGQKFHAMSPHSFIGGYDRDGIGNTLRFLMTSNSGLVLRNDEGVIGGMVAPVYFAPTKRVMEESFWWAGSGGMELLEAFEREARAMGAHFVLMSTLENGRAAATDRVMRVKGYKPVERRHMKELI